MLPLPPSVVAEKETATPLVVEPLDGEILQLKGVGGGFAAYKFMLVSMSNKLIVTSINNLDGYSCFCRFWLIAISPFYRVASEKTIGLEKRILLVDESTLIVIARFLFYWTLNETFLEMSSQTYPSAITPVMAAV